MTTNSRFIYIFLLLSSLMGYQCKTTHDSTSQKAMIKSIYINQFKLTYFRKLLLKGFNHSEAVQKIITFDHSRFTEPILTIGDSMLIDSLTTLDNLKMQKDSMTRIGRVAEGAEGKSPLDFILSELTSKWLDSLAQKRYNLSGISKSEFE